MEMVVEAVRKSIAEIHIDPKHPDDMAAALNNIEAWLTDALTAYDAATLQPVANKDMDNAENEKE